MERYQQNAHSAEPLLESVIITNPIHPLYGQSVKVLSIRRWGKFTKVIISAPNGGALSLSAEETSWSGDNWSEDSNKPLFNPKKLLRLSELVEKLSTLTPKKASNCQQPETVDNQKSNDKTVQNSASSPSIKPPSTINQSDSAVSYQNARYSNNQTKGRRN